MSETTANLYLITLGYYVGDKEIDRWRHRYHSRNHKGEYFVLGWAVTGGLMLLIEIFGGAEHGYHVPNHVAFVVGSVLVIYFITEYLKSEWRRRS